MTDRLRTLIIGFGVQGEKRRRCAGADCVGVVDPAKPQADWRDLSSVPTDAYDAAVLCTPDEPKTALVGRLVGAGKHVLLEKPFWAAEDQEIAEIEALARARGVAVRTAYNHRFEPHFKRMRALIESGELGRIYRCRMFYGNGTARLVRDSDWRDQGSGVLHDLGSHLLDTAAFWLGDADIALELASADRFENRAPDHAVLAGRFGAVRLEAEMTLLSWRNHFTADILAEAGSAHIESLCKWGPSRFTWRRRVLPSGRPPEESVTLAQDDPTWALEYDAFKRFAADVSAGRDATTLAWDVEMNQRLRRLGAQAVAACEAGEAA